MVTLEFDFFMMEIRFTELMYMVGEAMQKIKPRHMIVNYITKKLTAPPKIV